MRKLAFPIVALGLATATPAKAVTYCGASVLTEILTYGDGRVVIFAPWRGDYIDICNLQSTWKGVQTSTCFAWFANISTAVSLGKQILIYYAEDVSCATLPTYGGAPAPGFVRLSP